jgi:hypothetical protein
MCHRIANLKADKMCGRKNDRGDELLLLPPPPLLLLLLLLALAIDANAHATAVTYSRSPLKMILRAAVKRRRVIFDHSPRGKLDRFEDRSLA